MAKFLLALLLLLALWSCSQTAVVSGTAFDTAKGRNPVQIVLNDTLKRLRITSLEQADVYRKLMEDTNYVVRTKPDGSFRIRCKKSDSVFFHSYRHLAKAYAVTELLEMKNINVQLVSEPCVPYAECNDTVPRRTYAFIGRRIKVDPIQQPYYCRNVVPFDSRFEAEYEIVQQLSGHFGSDTIRFTVYDHYGTPSFSKYETVLLFVSEWCGKLIHQKYLYSELYPTIDGRWASPGDPYKYDDYHRKNLKAQHISFAGSLSFNVSGLTEAAIERQYPKPYFRIEGKRAIPVMGAYAEELLLVKKEGVLKARGVYLD